MILVNLHKYYILEFHYAEDQRQRDIDRLSGRMNGESVCSEEYICNM